MNKHFDGLYNKWKNSNMIKNQVKNAINNHFIWKIMLFKRKLYIITNNIDYLSFIIYNILYIIYILDIILYILLVCQYKYVKKIIIK